MNERVLIFIFLFISHLNLNIYAQEIPVHISATDTYQFIDELANEKIFSVNSCIKPYTRKEIVDVLILADSLREKLSLRQKKELDAYILEFTGVNVQRTKKKMSLWRLIPPELYYSGKNSSVIIRPTYSINYSVKRNGAPFYQTGGGAELLFYKGIVSAYASLTDNYFKREILNKPGYLFSGLGGNYKYNEGGRLGGDFSEMRGGVTINWKWGRIGFVKDHIQWGDNNFGGLIFAGQNPSFPMLVLHSQPFKWLTIDYVHGWLVSEVIDSSSSYYSKPGWFRGVYQPKYIAANMISFRPWKQLSVSIGNSIIYSDTPVQLVYLIPILFYKAVDHTLSHGIDNQNSQIFLNISSRNIKHTHLYGSVFIDEFSIRRITDPDRYNFFGYKLGGTLSNWPIKDLALDLEGTVIYPMVYKHRVASLTFATNKYNLGYFMGDNSFDFHTRIRYNPLPYLFAEIHYEYAVHGDEIDYINNIDIDRHSLIQNKTWERHLISGRLSYRPVIGLKVFAEVMYSQIKGFDNGGRTAQEYLDLYSPSSYQGKNLFLNFGFRLGL
ncbi:MAG: hypothetical protein WCL06_14635 [Bacteroidota bacterium]